MSTHPKVFVSHATEDKERFVTEFATRLRAKGIDAWLDQWEMLPGDSLVDKIFEEGVKQATAFIVVLSSISITKKWVREELNAGIVAKINRNCRVIPVVIDDCEIPEALKTTYYQRVKDVSSYEDEFKKIVAAIHGIAAKPPLGPAPEYVVGDSKDFAPELDRTDAAVLLTLCEAALEGGHSAVSNIYVLDKLKDQGIASEDIGDALDVLDQKGYIRGLKALNGDCYGNSRIIAVHTTLFGFDLFVRFKFADFPEMLTKIAALIVNEDKTQSGELEEASALPVMIVSHCVGVLENNGWLKVSKHSGGFSLYKISPELKRKLR